MQPILENDQDRRIYQWLIARVGERAVEDACHNLVGRRKPYLTNILKILNIIPPPQVVQTPTEEARQRLGLMIEYIKTKEKH